nr:Decaprenyl diphosphate synthase [Ipomoea batatas]
MGLPIIALAKLKLLKLTSQSVSTASFWLLVPFLLKLGYRIKPIHHLCHDFIYSARLFFFQMGQITFNGEPPEPGMADSRWMRALRLVAERLSRARHPQFFETDEESLRALAMIAL